MPLPIALDEIADFSTARVVLIKGRLFSSVPATEFAAADDVMSNAGGTMTGNLIISIAAGAYLAVNSNPGSYSYLKGMKGNKNRWFAYFGDATAETGGNAGSDFGIARFADDGTFLGSPFYIKRSTGAVKFGAPTGGYPDAEGKANFVDVEIQGESVKDALAEIAPRAAVSAWVNFNGTGTVAIRDSFNVSSITDNGVGDYTVNFATALADANYAVVGTCVGASATQVGRMVAVKGVEGTGPSSKSTTAVSVVSGNTGSGSLSDNADINIVITGGN